MEKHNYDIMTVIRQKNCKNESKLLVSRHQFADTDDTVNLLVKLPGKIDKIEFVYNAGQVLENLSNDKELVGYLAQIYKHSSLNSFGDIFTDKNNQQFIHFIKMPISFICAI